MAATTKRKELLKHEESDDEPPVESQGDIHSDRHLGAEASKVMGKDKDDRKKYQDYDDSFGTYFWNPETREFFGRTGFRWVQLVVFYTIFYIGLASFAGLCFYLFSLTLVDGRPKWILSESLIGSNPGMGYRPMPPDDNPESTLIWYNRKVDPDVKYWYKQLSDYMDGIDKPSQTCDLNNCSYNGTRANKDECCSINTADFGTACSKGTKFGYSDGDPCILLKLNKIFGWEPLGFGLNSKGRFDESQLTKDLNEQVNDYGMPKSLKKMIEAGLRKLPSSKDKEDYLSTIWISCEGEDVADKENIGNVNYYPQQGIPGYFFPYYNQKGYQSPFIFVQFQRPLNSVLINIECKAWAKNIKHDKQNRLGSVHFELMVD